MNFEAHIKELRRLADRNLAESRTRRDDFLHHKEIADRAQHDADAAAELARGFDLLADALSAGRLTADQLRDIIGMKLAEAQDADAQLDGEA